MLPVFQFDGAALSLSMAEKYRQIAATSDCYYTQIEEHKDKKRNFNLKANEAGNELNDLTEQSCDTIERVCDTFKTNT